MMNSSSSQHTGTNLNNRLLRRGIVTFYSLMLLIPLKSTVYHCVTAIPHNKKTIAFSTYYSENKTYKNRRMISRAFQLIITSKGHLPSSLIYKLRIHMSRQQYAKRTFSTSSESMTTTTSLSSSAAPTISSHTALTHNAVILKHIEFTKLESIDVTHPPVIFLHGLLGNKRNFATIGRSLSAQLTKSRRIFGLDLRNHGDNIHDWRNEMDFNSMADDVLQFMDSNNIDKAELIGHSIGGKVAQALALLQPERINGLVVIDIAPVQYTDDEPHWKAVTDIIDSLVSTNVQPGLSKRDIDIQLQSTISDPALRAFCLTNYDQKLGQWTVNLKSISSQLNTLAGFDVETTTTTPAILNGCSDDKRQYTGDAFFIHGGQSRFVRHKHIDQIAERFPNHMLTTVRGAGHWVHAEAPEDTTALLKRFLDR